VSVIIPTHNRAARVLEAIASVRAQSYGAVETIVVDDGSTDGTGAAVAALGDVRYVFQDRAGSGAARNAGLRLARGTLVASLDSDDTWHPEFLERSVAALESLDVDFVFANWVMAPAARSYVDVQVARGRLTGSVGEPAGDWSVIDRRDLRRMFLHGCPSPSSSLLIRRSSMPDRWNERVRVADDWYLLLEMVLRRPCRAAFTITPLWTKRVDGTNKHDGRSWSYLRRHLWRHDLAIFGRDFGTLLTPAERLRWRMWRAKSRARMAYAQARGRVPRAGEQLPSQDPVAAERFQDPVGAERSQDPVAAERSQDPVAAEAHVVH
jgi:glycosyltransferase involved in cell wall biosynthesis